MHKPSAPLLLLAAADVQGHLICALHDLERLQTLLSGACDTLLAGFQGANEELGAQQVRPAASDRAARHLCQAMVALQFHDMAAQLIAHTQRRLQSCADRLGRDGLSGDEDDAAAWIEAPPASPNPVTQGAMDAGSVTLF